MEVFFAIFSCILFVSSISIPFIKDEAKRRRVAIMIFSMIIALFSSFIAYEILCPIPPIEVYRGNTTLQITYQDSIPIDSVVVYKEK